MKPNKHSKSTQRCENCGERLIPARVSVYRRRKGRHVLFEKVPALVCRTCGHRVFEPDAVEAMELELNRPGGRRRKAELTIVPA
jgi:YgiT-type zinc finger domain-containing protein